MKRHLVWLSALLVAGCGTIAGPFSARKPVRVDDPRLTIKEQHQLGRDRLALPEESRQLPQSYGDFARPGSLFVDSSNN